MKQFATETECKQADADQRAASRDKRWTGFYIEANSPASPPRIEGAVTWFSDVRGTETEARELAENLAVEGYENIQILDRNCQPVS